jgi:hypothetical protein
MRRNKTILLSIGAIAITAASLLLFNRQTDSKVSAPHYKSMKIKQKENLFTDLKCLSPVDKATGKISSAFVLREESHVSPKGVPFRDVYVGIKITHPVGMIYSMQAVSYRQDACRSFLTLYYDNEDYDPLHNKFDQASANDIQLLWSKWQLENIPGWREYQQKRLNKPRVGLAEEEYLAFQKLGFKMPKKWEKLK